jgi:polysaccharide biosynthesis/export protein
MKFLNLIFTSLFGVFVLTNAVLAQDQKTPDAVASTAVAPQLPPNNIRGYQLGPGDEIEIKVLGEPTFGGKYTVDDDGKIVLEFVEKPIHAGCRTEREIRAEVAKAWAKFLRNPQINLRVTEKRSRPAAVVYGEVRSPQQVVMNRRLRLMELISFSGGVTDQASGVVQVVHTQPLICPEPGDEQEPQPTGDGLNVPFQVYSLSDIRAGKNEANPLIRPGDLVIIQKAAPVYIIGEVRSPRNELAIPERGLSLTDAVAMVGGVTREAKKKDVRIYRLKPNSRERETISANLDSIKKGQQKDVILQPFDVVEVEKAPKSAAQFLTEILTGGVRNVANALPTRVAY